MKRFAVYLLLQCKRALRLLPHMLIEGRRHNGT